MTSPVTARRKGLGRKGNPRMKLNLFYAAVFAVAAIVTFIFQVAAVGADQPVDDNIQICHGTNAVDNPYTTQSVDPDSIGDNNGGDHSTHTGPIASTTAIAQALKDAHIDWGDIIPAHNGFPGLNWTPEGIAIYNNGCSLPTPTLSPSPSPSPSPTPTPTPSPTPTVPPTDTPTPTPTPEPTPVKTTPSPTPSTPSPSATPTTPPTLTPPPSTPPTLVPPVSLPPTGGDPARQDIGGVPITTLAGVFAILGIVALAYIVTRS